MPAHALHTIGADTYHGVAGETDPRPHLMYPWGYDHRCSWCWLGHAHTEAAHLECIAEVEAQLPPAQRRPQPAAAEPEATAADLAEYARYEGAEPDYDPDDSCPGHSFKVGR